jgi:hypothetical protein
MVGCELSTLPSKPRVPRSNRGERAVSPLKGGRPGPSKAGGVHRRVPENLDPEQRHVRSGDRVNNALLTLSGLTPRVLAKLRERIFGKISPEPNSGCWLWTGSCSTTGYGSVGVGSKASGKPFVRVAHRVVWLLERGDIPRGLVLDHKCRNPTCVNPAHLEPVPHKENKRRGLQGVLRTSCKNGHPVEGNTNPSGRCRICKTAEQRRWDESQKAKALARRAA